QVEAVEDAGEARKEVVGDRVVDARADLVLVLEGRDDGVPLGTGGPLETHGVLVVHVHRARAHGRRGDPLEVRAEERGVRLAAGRPAGSLASWARPIAACTSVMRALKPTSP